MKEVIVSEPQKANLTIARLQARIEEMQQDCDILDAANTALYGANESLQSQLEEVTNRNDENLGMCRIWATRYEELKTQLAESQRRERAAVWELNQLGDCTVCRHNKWPCEREDIGHRKCFEWRGPQNGEGEKG